jgi:hypothetical protein
MLFLFFIHFLSASVQADPAIRERGTAPSCDNINECRTLLGIIWSCLTTIFLCTWVAVHPNIPRQEDLRDKTFLQKYRHKVSRFFQNKLPLFLCTLFIPEYVLAWAIRQRLGARRISEEYGMLSILPLICPSDATHGRSRVWSHTNSRILHYHGRISLFL